ncbi:uncharacterized protein LOC142625009 [Castanea sativa]|uniref:uncharacterized protein LOC142625009 n=1 Tax=Castanea sativa TaxID=21020 RepID=UPI003F65000E
MIIGGTVSGGSYESLKKTYYRQINSVHIKHPSPKCQRLETDDITFSERDVDGIKQPHNDPLIIMLEIEGFKTRRVLVDNESFADIMYMTAYQQLRFDPKKLKPFNSPLVSFSGDKIYPKRIVSLSVTAGTYPAQFPTPYGIGKICGDQLLAKECYQAVLASKENHAWVVEEEPGKPTQELEEVCLVEGDATKVTKVGARLDSNLKDKIMEFRKQNLDIFAWTHEDMPGIDNKVIEHKLDVDPTRKPVQQKRRVFAP